MADLTPQEIATRSKNNLITFAKNYKIFIDTCSLLSPYAEDFWNNIIPVLESENTNIVVPHRVYQEVDKFASNPTLCQQKNPDNPDFNNLAKKAKQRILNLQSRGLIRILGDKTDNFADNVFQTVFTQYRMKYNLLLITQDKNLSEDILRIKESKAVTVNNKLEVKRINKYGYLSNFDFPQAETKKNTEKPQSKVNINKKEEQEEVIQIPEEEMFALADHITQTSGTVHVSYYPQENDSVFAVRDDKKERITLLSKISAGGEGTIYTTNITNTVAKIYKPGKIDKAKYEKLKLMISKNIFCEGVCLPFALIYNEKNEFVGYLMHKARGIVLQKSVFIPMLLKKYFPDWKKKDTVQLCITILEKLKYLHDRNIILGDINPQNILVVSPTEVYFVDTDSYQIEGYPCPVGTINFTAPEIQRKKYDTFLRTMGNEQFAVATLLFMIMLPGKPPYSLQGGENQIDNIINGDFAYASGERTNGKAPEGLWRYIWSHLPRYLKDDFYETFKKGGRQNTEDTRFSDRDWLIKFRHYATILEDENGQFLSNDIMSSELFPTRLKKDIKTVYIQCNLCGRDVDQERTEQGYCRECLNDGEHYSCTRCGNEMVYTNYQKLIRHSRKFDTCRTCNDALNSIYRKYPCACCGTDIEITYRKKEILAGKNKSLPTVHDFCRDAAFSTVSCANPYCSNKFTISYGEKEYFESKGFDLPKKCSSCRGTKTPYVPTYTAPRNTQRPVVSTHNSAASSPGKKKSTLCFITTAVCKYFNKPDDCYELTTLRRFRDTWLALQNNGEDLIKEYYRIAPSIVTAIDSSENTDEIYIHIWNDYIQPCIKLIELSAYEECRDLYMRMVNELKDQYSKTEVSEDKN